MMWSAACSARASTVALRHLSTPTSASLPASVRSPPSNSALAITALTHANPAGAVGWAAVRTGAWQTVQTGGPWAWAWAGSAWLGAVGATWALTRTVRGIEEAQKLDYFLQSGALVPTAALRDFIDAMRPRPLWNVAVRIQPPHLLHTHAPPPPSHIARMFKLGLTAACVRVVRVLCRCGRRSWRRWALWRCGPTDCRRAARSGAWWA